MSDQVEQTTEQLLTQLVGEIQAMRQVQAAQAEAQRAALPTKSADEVIAQFKAQAEAQREADRQAAEESAEEETPWWDKEDELDASDAVSVARKAEAAVRKDLEAQNKRLQARLDAVEAQQKETADSAQAAARVAAEDRQMRFASELNQLDPEFFTHINGSDGWKSFLDEVNPTTMRPFGESMAGAYASGNAQQAFNIAQLYRSRMAAQTEQNPSSALGASVVPFPGGRAAHVDAPTRGAARVPLQGGQTGQPGAIIYTQEVINDIQGRMRHENWSKEQKNRFYADLKLAEAQGRLRV